MCLVAISCKNGKSDQLILMVSPDAAQTAKSGQILTFTLNVKSQSLIKKVTIAERRNTDFLKVIADTVPDGNVFRWEFEYRVPNLESEQELLDIYFTVSDTEGNSVKSLRIISVFTDTKGLLTETTGYTMYSSASTDFNAFNLTENKLIIVPLFDTLQTIDSSMVHIVDASGDKSSMLSRQWKSLAGCQFVRFNDLDYGNATATALKSAYENGLKRDFVEKITEEDLIITRYSKTDSSEFQYAVFKIVQVIEVDGTASKDRYIFNVKK